MLTCLLKIQIYLRAVSPSAVSSDSKDTSSASSDPLLPSSAQKSPKREPRGRTAALILKSKNPMLWNVKMTDYRNKGKKNKVWDDKAELMGRTVENLKGWFGSLRDTHTRLDKKKGGDGAANLTEREQV